MSDEPFGVNAHLELLLVAAPAVDLGDALHRSQLRLDDPIVKRAQLDKLVDPLFIRQCREVISLVGQDVMEDLA